jgi:hypothetical protein
VLVEFILGGRLSVPPAKILREVTLDTLGRRRACDKVSRQSLMSIHHASSKQRQQSGAANATEARSASTTTPPVYKSSWIPALGMQRKVGSIGTQCCHFSSRVERSSKRLDGSVKNKLKHRTKPSRRERVKCI